MNPVTDVVAKYQIDDMVRNAEAYRRSRGTRSALAKARRERARRVATWAASLVLWPIRH